MTTSQHHPFELLTVSAQKKLLDRELGKEVERGFGLQGQQPSASSSSIISSSIATQTTTTKMRISALERRYCAILGLDVESLMHFVGDAKKRDEMIELAKRMSVLLLYEPGVWRAQALVALWGLLNRERERERERERRERGQYQNQHQHQHQHQHLDDDDEASNFSFNLNLHLRTPHEHEHEYVLVRYVSPNVVPLIDYWPPSVRDAFAKGVWRFVYAYDSVSVSVSATAGAVQEVDVDGEEGGKGEGKVIFEIREWSLGIMEWLMEMEGEREREKEREKERVRDRLGRLRI